MNIQRLSLTAFLLGAVLSGCASNTSVFDSDSRLGRECTAVARLGEYVGEARMQGMDVRSAADDAASRLAANRGLPRTQGLTMTAQVYGMLIYRLDEFQPLTTSAYALTSCLTIKGHRKAMPADAESEAKINAVLRRCEDAGHGRDERNVCVMDGIKPMVASFESLQ